MNTFRVLLLVLLAAATTLTFPNWYADAKVGDCEPGSYRFAGTVSSGQTFSHRFDGFLFALVPNKYGWDIDISRGEQHYLANITGPQHSVPNPIEIEGWHFRNTANTDVNKGDVNAPQWTRRFLFSPRWQQCQDSAALEKDGQGTLKITDLELGNLIPGEKATIKKMSFEVTVGIGASACRSCPPKSK